MSAAPKLTRAAFVMLADVLKRTRDGYAPHWDPNLFRACDDHARALADALAMTSPAFDRWRFLQACGARPAADTGDERMRPGESVIAYVGRTGAGGY